jgi:KUP system potassium uptake protein
MGVMVATTASMFVVTTQLWGWATWMSGALFGGFLLIDLLYLSACALKLLDGGWLPLAFAGLLLYVMLTWRRGRHMMSAAYRAVARMPMSELLAAKRQVTQLPRAMVFLTQERVETEADGTPVLLMKFLDRYGGLPKHVTLFTVVNEAGVPFWLGRRFDVVNFGENVVSVRMHVGYMETPDLRAALVTLKRRKLVKIHATHWTIVMGKEEILIAEGKLWWRIGFLVYRTLLQMASQAHIWFGLGSDPGLSKEVVPVRVTPAGGMEVVLRRTEHRPFDEAASGA